MLTIDSLYITNLPSNKIQKLDLRLSLYTLFSTYGPVLDVVALKTMKMRGQAHVVFRDIHSATQAMRELQGVDFLGRELVSSWQALPLLEWAKQANISRSKYNTQSPSPTHLLSSMAPSTSQQQPPLRSLRQRFSKVSSTPHQQQPLPTAHLGPLRSSRHLRSTKIPQWWMLRVPRPPVQPAIRERGTITMLGERATTEATVTVTLRWKRTAMMIREIRVISACIEHRSMALRRKPLRIPGRTYFRKLDE